MEHNIGQNDLQLDLYKNQIKHGSINENVLNYTM